MSVFVLMCVGLCVLGSSALARFWGNMWKMDACVCVCVCVCACVRARARTHAVVFKSIALYV